MHPLDNPTWNALTTYQSPWARSQVQARRFPAEVCVHGAFEQATPEAWQSLASMARDPVNIFSLEPLDLSPDWTITRKLEMYQMVQEEPERLLTPRDRESAIVELAASDLAEMTELYAATRPGRVLCPRMHELGGFIGVRDAGRLVAMACLRLHLPGYREISTVGTRPGDTGHGHATAVVAELARRIHAAGEKPFLTVQTNNKRAIGIYRRLGFRERTFMHSTTLRFA
jgi:ribosomal protein S18 acetylase RimI-like enzyme